MKQRKWSHQDNYTDLQCALDEIDYWTYRHIHWLWRAYQSVAQWLRDGRSKL